MKECPKCGQPLIKVKEAGKTRLICIAGDWEQTKIESIPRPGEVAILGVWGERQNGEDIRPGQSL